MNPLSRSRAIAVAGIALGLFGLAGAAQAHTDVFFSIGVPGVYAQPAPVYVQPAPVYVEPQPVYVEPPRVYAPPTVYVQPGYTWEQRQAWRREQWRRHYWRERQWEHRRWHDDD